MMKDKLISREVKRKSVILIRVLLFVIPMFTTLFIIGNHSDYLIKKPIKIISLILLIISIIGLIVTVGIVIINKNSGRVVKHRIRFWILNVLTILYCGATITVLVLLYGPNYNFRDWLISTAMQTMHHQYYCQIFYSPEEIADSMRRNYIIESGEDTDPSLIDLENGTIYANEYEKQILKKDYEDQLYKIIRFQVNGQDAFLAAVYDPSRVFVGYTKYLNTWGQYVTDMAKDAEAPLAINGGGFVDENYNSNGQTPIGITISRGKTITNSASGYGTGGIIGLTNDNILVLLKNKTAEQAKAMGVRDAVSMGPFLIVNGKPSFVKGNGGWGYAARTAIGQRKDGIILLLVINSNETRTKGASMVDLTEIMQNYGAINAANLDGGTSSVMVENYEIINDPIDSALRHKTRPIATCWLVK